MSFTARLARFARATLDLVGRPARTARGERGVVLQPYRGYGSRDEVFLIGRVFRQSRRRDAQGGRGLRDSIRDVLRRLMRRSVAGARVRASFYGATTVTETDRDGYFRVQMGPGRAVPENTLWHPLELTLESPERAEAEAEVFVPPRQARFAVVSDIDDTVMRTGVANRLVMLWRLFVQEAHGRTAFPGVSALYRALHAGRSGDEANPMLYVSRAPWGIYDILDTFFRLHGIPNGPILFLREWGVTWRSPLPRRAQDHKRRLIDAMMDLYRDMPFVLIGDSGQHDPEVYREIVAREGKRVLAVYIRNVSSSDRRRTAEIEALTEVVVAAGSELVLAADSAAMAEHAAKLGLIAPEAVEAVRRRMGAAERQAAAGRESRVTREASPGEAAAEVERGLAEMEAGRTGKIEVAPDGAGSTAAERGPPRRR